MDSQSSDGKGMLNPGVLMLTGLLSKDLLILFGKLRPEFNTTKGSFIGLIFMIQLILSAIVYYFYKRDKGEMELLTRPKEFIKKNKIGVAFGVLLLLSIAAMYLRRSPMYNKIQPSMKIKILAGIVGAAGLYVLYNQYKKRSSKDQSSLPSTESPGAPRPSDSTEPIM